MQFMGVKVDWPLDMNIIRRGTENNTFGMVRINTDNTPRPHQGWDFFAKVGTPCFAVADGKVHVCSEQGALGLLLVISIGDTGKYAAYAHLLHTEVKVGDVVKLGQHVGTTGNSGNAAGMKGLDEHLHFEIRDKPLTGLGLADRISPFKLFNKLPLRSSEAREAL